MDKLHNSRMSPYEKIEALESIRCQIQGAWRTDEIRRQKPTPQVPPPPGPGPCWAGRWGRAAVPHAALAAASRRLSLRVRLRVPGALSADRRVQNDLQHVIRRNTQGDGTLDLWTNRGTSSMCTCAWSLCRSTRARPGSAPRSLSSSPRPH